VPKTLNTNILIPSLNFPKKNNILNKLPKLPSMEKYSISRKKKNVFLLPLNYYKCFIFTAGVFMVEDRLVKME